MAAQNDTTRPPVTQLPSDTVEFAHRMFDAARSGDSTLLLAAVDAGLPVNLTNSQGNSLLMLASYAGHAQLVQDLLSRGADPNRLNDLGQSMVAGAVFKGHDDVVGVLMRNGANPRIGRPTAIETAAVFGKGKETMDVLGAKEGDVGKDVPLPPSTVNASKNDG
ncbi:ankyrin repeat-containing domain protein [Amanita rubescens]|nr:ankyrin repeat-containing domain protein [Amanita rubescens]